VGIAGGIKDVRLGDVVAATKVCGYEGGADRDHFQPRPDIGLSSYPLVQEAQIVAREEKWLAGVHQGASDVKPQAFVGPIAAGAKVIKSSSGMVATLLRENYGDALAVEMEGEGFMRAAYSNKIDGMVVRGVSDLLDGKAAADSSGSQSVASDHAAAFAFELLARLASKPISTMPTEGRQGEGKQAASPTCQIRLVSGPASANWRRDCIREDQRTAIYGRMRVATYRIWIYQAMRAVSGLKRSVNSKMEVVETCHP